MLKIKACVKRISDILLAFYIEIKLLRDERHFDDRFVSVGAAFPAQLVLLGGRAQQGRGR